ncbi:LOW QUALITY PROTEIN: hypothetical protein CRUP_011200 [Coryphaenoides rupestris]|nr:LOW QUALITY PROTEIN: hypothetical protein CRUP_011200 [Coryphaenoides rupestris]
MHIAAANGYVQAAELLLEGGGRMDLKDSDGWQPLHAAACWGQMHVAELLVSHGASLNAKTSLEETPIGRGVQSHPVGPQTQNDIIMKSQLKHKTSLCRRTSSAGSRGKVVRRASLSDRHNLCRKEYDSEAIVWRGGREGAGTEAEPKEKEAESQEDSPVVHVKPAAQLATSDSPAKLTTILKDKGDGSGRQNGLVSTATSTPPQPSSVRRGRPSPSSNGSARSPATGKGPTAGTVTAQPVAGEEAWPRERAQTLSELKRQRAAAKLLLSHPLFSLGHLGNGSLDSFADANKLVSGGGGGAVEEEEEDPRMPLVSSNGSAVYYTPASGDPPMLRLKQPMEEERPKTRTCCCVS